VGVDPAEGEVVSKHTLIVAELVYSVSGFREGQFFLMPQLATTDPAKTSSGPVLGGHPILREASGRLTISFPLEAVWDMREIRKPFRIWFYLNERTGSGKSRVVAKTTPIDYKTR
jgi:hypothetical protein